MNGEIQSLGVIEHVGLSPSFYTADLMLKAAPIHLIEIEYSGGLEITTKITGETEAVRDALEIGKSALPGSYTGSDFIPNPAPGLEKAVYGKLRYIGILSAYSKYRFTRPEPIRFGERIALGMLETQGFLPLAVAADVMLKAAEVSLIATEKVGGMMATAFIHGKTSDFQRAIEAGRAAVAQIGTPLVGAYVLERPHEEIREAVFGCR